MNIPKKYIGKMVELQWMDTQFDSVNCDISPKGRAALATWLERGTIVDVSEGVVKIEHSLASHAGHPAGTSDEHSYTAIPEVLIESITVFVPERLDTLPQVLPG